MEKVKKIAFFCFFSIVVTRVIFYFIYIVHCDGNSFEGFLNQIDYWDAIWYKSIVTQGYPATAAKQASWAFFPFYPMVIRIIRDTTGLNIDLIGFLVSNICCYISCIYSYKYIMITRSKRGGGGGHNPENQRHR